MAKDLFADTTMSFGEHLEALRGHLFRCVVYLLVACAPAAYFAEDVLDLVTAPILGALEDYDPDAADSAEEFKENALDAFDWQDWWPGGGRTRRRRDRRRRGPAGPRGGRRG